MIPIRSGSSNVWAETLALHYSVYTEINQNLWQTTLMLQFPPHPLMRHIIRALLELSWLNLWSQQGSSAQGCSALCSKWEPLLWWGYFWMFQSVRLLRTDCSTQDNRQGLKESSHQTWSHTVVTCSCYLIPTSSNGQVSASQEVGI